MQAWLCENPTGVDALTWKELPTPQPKAGEVLIEIKAASLNFPDLLIVQNKYQMKPPLPFVPGSEYAGVVRAGVAVLPAELGEQAGEAALVAHPGLRGGDHQAEDLGEPERHDRQVVALQPQAGEADDHPE